LTQWRRDRTLFLDYFEFRNRNLYWYDLYSSTDPVPNGHLLDKFFEQQRLYSIEVSNMNSLIGDHTSYWKAKDDFVQRVTHLLLREAGIAARDVSSYRATRRRVWRVGWLTAARWLLGLAAITLAAQWTAHSPLWIATLYHAMFPASAGGGAAARHEWTDALAASAPLVAAFAAWVILIGVLHFGWRLWDKEEFDNYLNRRDYLLGASGLWWTLAAPLVLLGVAVYEIAGVYGVALLLVFAVTAASVARASRRFRAFLQRHSRSGTATELAQLDRTALQAQCHRAIRHGDQVALTLIGQRLRGLDNDLARRALHAAAFELNHANAAWTLGGLHEDAARNAQNDAERQHEKQLAIEAYVRGAELGDPLSARWVAYTLEKEGKKDEALDFYRRAFELGDAVAAHSVGMQLMQQGQKDEARRVYEDGIRRGDRLSALFLASHFETLAGEAQGDEAVALNRRAADLYRVAFDLGHAGAARQAGDLLRRMRDIAAARRAYALGARLRDATAALRLGQLEHEEEEDLEAAQNAYYKVIRLDTLGADTAEALLGLGALREQQRRPQAAKACYREALWMKNGRHVSAKAAISLARLLEPAGYAGENEARQALQRASTLAPKVAADAYLEILKRHHDREAVAALTPAQIDGLSASGLVSLADLLRYTEPQRARLLLERAFSMNTVPGSVEAAVELLRRLVSDGDFQAEGKLIDATLTQGSYFASKVAELMDQKNFSTTANKLRKRLEEANKKQGNSDQGG
jgi:tetratricopeptide (TPR) repeat protein